MCCVDKNIEYLSGAFCEKIYPKSEEIRVGSSNGWGGFTTQRVWIRGSRSCSILFPQFLDVFFSWQSSQEVIIPFTFI